MLNSVSLATRWFRITLLFRAAISPQLLAASVFAEELEVGRSPLGMVGEVDNVALGDDDCDTDGDVVADLEEDSDGDTDVDIEVEGGND